MGQQLAILGGEKAFSKQYVEQWQRPKDREKKLVNQLIDQDHLSGSGYGIGKLFEESFTRLVGCKHCLTFSHGTAALNAAYYAVGVGPGDEVITPASGYIASYIGAFHMGARPIFCDIDPDTWVIDPQEVKKKITGRTKAINLIHMNGRICDLDALRSISEEYSIPLIDDASHVHGGQWGDKIIGNFEHITCFSMQGVNPTGKPVGAGEGGIACTNNDESFHRMLFYCHLHRKKILEDLQGSPYASFDKEVLGLKWRAHPLALALGIVSMESLTLRNSSMDQNRKLTEQILKKYPFIKCPHWLEHSHPAGFYGGLKFFYLPDQLKNLPFEKFSAILLAEGVPIKFSSVGDLEYRRKIFNGQFDLWGDGRGPVYKEWEGLKEYSPPSPEDFPVSERMKDSVFALPNFIDVENQYFDDLERALEKVSNISF